MNQRLLSVENKSSVWKCDVDKDNENEQHLVDVRAQRFGNVKHLKAIVYP